ncbi:hypothetical protein [Mucilaginibacter sp. L196]|uniref:helix-turn-helix transcriptional regulator n=1 Tax=Mucilaginibacter sp. L196 TaxID=1641870 RepID=UPI00131AA0A2|nr:hypothetical protein [Mucilaginibacter sp. L196]
MYSNTLSTLLMSGKKFIVIGCDNAVHLYSVLNNINETAILSYNIVSTARISDLIDLVKSLKPDLVILSFRSMPMLIKDINRIKPEVPILCINNNFDAILNWDKNCVVFTCQFEYITRAGYLNGYINSILLLRSISLKKEVLPAQSLAQAAAIKNTEIGNDRSLSRYVLELDQKVEVLLKIKERIADLYPLVNDSIRAELSSIVHWIKMSANNSKLWDDFRLYFEQSDPNFLLQLAQIYPDLTPIDLKYCCYLKMNMSNDDIKNLLGINQESVRTHKYRLKKKMSLTADQDLKSYLITVGQKSARLV